MYTANIHYRHLRRQCRGVNKLESQETNGIVYRVRYTRTLNAEGKLRKLVYQNDARALSPVDAISAKMAVRKTSIFGEVYLFSDTVVYAFSEAAFGEILASI